MKQILISMHINRELHALRFALIFFFCSENLRLFFIQLGFIKIRCSSLFVYIQETSSTQSVHWYSIRTCNHSRALYRYTLAHRVIVTRAVIMRNRGFRQRVVHSVHCERTMYKFKSRTEGLHFSLNTTNLVYVTFVKQKDMIVVNSENRKITPLGPPPPTYLIFAKTSTAPKLGISHLMIPLMDALGVSHLGKIEFRSYGHLKTADSYT